MRANNKSWLIGTAGPRILKTRNFKNELITATTFLSYLKKQDEQKIFFTLTKI